MTIELISLPYAPLEDDVFDAYSRAVMHVAERARPRSQACGRGAAAAAAS